MIRSARTAAFACALLGLWSAGVVWGSVGSVDALVAARPPHRRRVEYLPGGGLPGGVPGGVPRRRDGDDDDGDGDGDDGGDDGGEDTFPFPFPDHPFS